MSAFDFITELEAYLVDTTLNEYDRRRIAAMFNRYKVVTVTVKEYVDRPIYREKLIYLDNNGDVMAKSTKEKKDMPNPDELVKRVAAFWGLEPDNVRSKRRDGNHPHCRFMIMMILREYGYHYTAIGKILGNRDHTTIINGVREACNMLDTNHQPFSTYWHNWRAQEKERENGTGQRTDKGDGDKGTDLPGLQRVEEQQPRYQGPQVHRPQGCAGYHRAS